MIKINKFKKQTDRLLVVSEKKLYKVDAAKIKVISIVHLGSLLIRIQHVTVLKYGGHSMGGKHHRNDNEHADAGDEGGGSGAGHWDLLRQRG